MGEILVGEIITSMRINFLAEGINKEKNNNNSIKINYHLLDIYYITCIGD